MSTDSKKKKEKREKLEGLIAKRRAEEANEEDNDKLYFYSCFNCFKVKPFFSKRLYELLSELCHVKLFNILKYF